MKKKGFVGGVMIVGFLMIGLYISPTYGACGTAQSGSYSALPTDNSVLCSASHTGTYTGFASNSTWTRGCTGADGPTDCSAFRTRTGNLIGSGYSVSGTVIYTSGTTLTFTGTTISGSLLLSGVRNIIVSSGTWNGVFLPPSAITGTSAATGGSLGIWTGTIPLLTIQVGSTGASIQASGGYFTIQFTVASGFVGQTLKIYRFGTGGTRRLNTLSGSCKLDGQKLCSFNADHLSVFTVGSIDRDNMNYLNVSFWNAGPLDAQIVRALYGTGGGQTAYTQNRSGRNGSQCDLTGMLVQYVGPGTGTLPHNLSGNTIYVLTGGDYITTGTINFSGCSSIIGQTGSYLYSTGYLPYLLLNSGAIAHNTIIHNINIHGSGAYHSGTGNDYGVTFSGNTINNTLYKLNIYNHGIAGAALFNSNLNTLNNIKTYNNLYGIVILAGTNNILNNVSSFNNEYGIIIQLTNNNTLNNMQVWNNIYYGIITVDAVNNIITNSLIFNNTYYGIGIQGTGNILNNISVFNNTTGLLIDPTSTGNKYYGDIKLFGNTLNIGGSGERLTTGSTSILTGLSVSVGTITTGATLSRGNISNPINASNNYLLSRTTGYTNLRGQFTGRLATMPISYSIGGYTPLQTQPIKWNLGLTGFEYYGSGGDRNSSSYIGSDITALTGDMTLSSANNTFSGQKYSKTGELTVTITSTGAYYLLTGSFTGRVGTFSASTSIQTGISLFSGDGLKTVILQLGTGSTGSNRATHYGFNVILDTILPIFTGTTATGALITSGLYINTTGVQFTGSDLYFSGMTINSLLYTGLRITGDNAYTFIVNDLAGNSTGARFTIDTTYPTFIGSTSTGLVLVSGQTYTADSFSFTFSDTNISGASLSGVAYTGGTAITAEGTYIFIATDKANNQTGITFTFVKALSGQLILSGGSMVWNSTAQARYTKSEATILARSNKTGGVTVTGEFSTQGGSFTESINANQRKSYTLTMTGGEGARFIYATFTGFSSVSGVQSLSLSKAVVVDNSGPVITNIYPNSGQTALSGNITFLRSGVDSGVGMSGYYYNISTSDTFASYITSGFTTGATKSISSYYILLNSGTYYRNIIGIDKLGNRGTGNTQSFDYIATADSVPDTFSFTSVSGADLDTAYMSNTITITGLTLNVSVPISIDNGVLYISGIVVGRTGTVRQGDTVKIELISSSDYEETVTSTLTIGSLTVRYRVTTDSQGSSNSDISLSTSTRLNIAIVFDTIADLYSDNISKQVEFMVTFKSMLEDLIDTMESDHNLSSSEERKLSILRYLLDLTEEFIDDNNISDSDVHTAPNGKRYIIIYDTPKACYTSPNFLSPNKCFPSLTVMKSYIDANNLARTHTADTSRTAVSHIAPSGKTYIILKTTDGRYFSYRFISPKYFNSLVETKDYINRNNPKNTGR